MKKSKDLFRLPIIALQEGREIGKVKDLVIDPQKREVSALLVEDREWFRNPKALLYSSIKALGNDAVIVETINDVCSLSQTNELEPLLEQQVKIVDTRCISTDGRYMGRVTEFLIDTDTGKITGLEITSPSSSQKPTLVPIEKALTLSSDLIIAQEQEAPSRLYDQPTKPLDIPSPRTKVPNEAIVAAREEKSQKASEARPSAESGVRKILEERQDAYLLGKEVRKDVVTDNGAVIIKAGDTINPEVIEKAKQSDKYLALSFSIRRT